MCTCPPWLGPAEDVLELSELLAWTLSAGAYGCHRLRAPRRHRPGPLPPSLASTPPGGRLRRLCLRRRYSRAGHLLQVHLVHLHAADTEATPTGRRAGQSAIAAAGQG